MGVPRGTRLGLDPIVFEQGGVIDQKGHRAERRFDGWYEGLNLSLVGEISTEGHRFAAKRVKALDDLLSLITATSVVDRDVKACLANS